MSAKESKIFSKLSLLSTMSGKKIVKHILLQEKGYTQYRKYKDQSEKEFSNLRRDFYYLSMKN
jgi:hypothetical protein